MKLTEIAKGQVFTVVASEIEARLCGAYKAGFYPDGRIAVKYVDGGVEMAKFDIAKAQEIADKTSETFFAVVGEVQSKRGTEDEITGRPNG